jgi:hypothetical protein
VLVPVHTAHRHVVFGLAVLMLKQSTEALITGHTLFYGREQRRYINDGRAWSPNSTLNKVNRAPRAPSCSNRSKSPGPHHRTPHKGRLQKEKTLERPQGKGSGDARKNPPPRGWGALKQTQKALDKGYFTSRSSERASPIRYP